MFYINVPIGLIAIALAWAASAGWETPRRPGRVDLVGAALFSVGLAALLGGLTLIDGNLTNRLLDPSYPPGPLLLLAVICIALTIVVGVRRPDPFLDPRLFRSGVFSSAALVSLLTGYALATAIVGGAVFVDRVLYGGPDQQRIALGALAGMMAVGALVSGFAVRVLSLRWVTLIGLGLSIGALWRMSTWTTETPIADIAIALAVFGLGFGLTVTPRSTAAVEAVGRAHFGMASATVTVARMIGMAVGLAILVAYGSTVIESRSAAVYATPDAYKQFIPESPARSAAARRAGRRRAGGLGRGRGAGHHRGPVPRGRGADGRRRSAGARARRPARPGAAAGAGRSGGDRRGGSARAAGRC